MASAGSSRLPYCRHLALKADDPDVVFVATGDGAAGRTGAIQRSKDGGRSWAALPLPVEPNSPIWAFATNRADPGLIFACSHYGELFKSRDAGNSWSKLPREFTENPRLGLDPELSTLPGSARAGPHPPAARVPPSPVATGEGRGGGWHRRVIVLGLLAGLTTTAAAEGRVTAAAVWRPPAGFFDRFHRDCDGRAGKAFADCFVAAMGRAGAAPAALAFARRLDGAGYLESLEETGAPVAVAHVVYPFRANQNDGWLLVNGSPALIDVDDRRYLSLDAMRAAPAYRDIERRIAEVTFWPGDRGGAAAPTIAMSGQEIIVGYLLRNLCHACAIVGRVRFAFDFDHAGGSLGAHLVSVAATDR